MTGTLDGWATRAALLGVQWIEGHPTVWDPQHHGDALRRCVRCNTREGWLNADCRPGLIVHPHAGAGLGVDGYASQLRRAWLERGYDPQPVPPGEHPFNHPHDRACPRCNAPAIVQALDRLAATQGPPP